MGLEQFSGLEWSRELGSFVGQELFVIVGMFSFIVKCSIVSALTHKKPEKKLVLGIVGEDRIYLCLLVATP